MNKLLILVCTVLICSLSYAQQNFMSEKTKVREQNYNNEYSRYWLNDYACDTLLLEDDTPVYLLRTPIRYIDGYTGLFASVKSIYDCEVLFSKHLVLGDRGYYMTWRLKDKKLYLEKVWWDRIEMYGINKDGEMGPWKGPDVSPEEIKRRVEQLTLRKFDEEGLLFADWVTDRILIAKYHPYQLAKDATRVLTQPLNKVLLNQTDTYFSKIENVDKNRDEVSILNRKQKIFALDFIKGKLREIHECTNISQEQLLKELHEKGK